MHHDPSVQPIPQYCPSPVLADCRTPLPPTIDQQPRSGHEACLHVGCDKSAAEECQKGRGEEGRPSCRGRGSPAAAEAAQAGAGKVSDDPLFCGICPPSLRIIITRSETANTMEASVTRLGDADHDREKINEIYTTGQKKSKAVAGAKATMDHNGKLIWD